MITTLTGANSFLLRHELNQLISDFVAEYTDMGLERLDGEEVSYDRMREALESLPFLASKKLVVLRSPGANKEFTEKAPELLSNVGDMTDVVIVEPKLDKRLAYYKFLKKNSEFKEFSDLDESSLSRWLVEQVTMQGGSLAQTDARYLVGRVAGGQQLLANELAKLLSYNPTVTRQTIDLLTDRTPQSTIFELLDAAMGGRSRQALELYQEQRAMKVEPQQIIALLAWQLHVLAVVKAAGDRDPAVIAREAKLNPFVVRKTQSLASRMNLPQIKKLIHDTLTLDIRLKSEPIDADEALQNLLATATGK
ncbi:MAG TPA: DNA polymerase III subunit delta [Candidatus Limnocylindria bacterium]|nr:DNA polymerase III subunit delta [Candidatus Limnocylindria bacterium]